MDYIEITFSATMTCSKLITSLKVDILSTSDNKIQL